MRERLGAIELTPKVRKSSGTRHDVRVQHLECDVTACLGKICAMSVRCLVYGAHATATENTLERVAVDQRAVPPIRGHFGVIIRRCTRSIARQWLLERRFTRGRRLRLVLGLIWAIYRGPDRHLL